MASETIPSLLCKIRCAAALHGTAQFKCKRMRHHSMSRGWRFQVYILIFGMQIKNRKNGQHPLDRMQVSCPRSTYAGVDVSLFRECACSLTLLLLAYETSTANYFRGRLPARSMLSCREIFCLFDRDNNRRHSQIFSPSDAPVYQNYRSQAKTIFKATTKLCIADMHAPHNQRLSRECYAWFLSRACTLQRSFILAADGKPMIISDRAARRRLAGITAHQLSLLRYEK